MKLSSPEGNVWQPRFTNKTIYKQDQFSRYLGPADDYSPTGTGKVGLLEVKEASERQRGVKWIEVGR